MRERRFRIDGERVGECVFILKYMLLAWQRISYISYNSCVAITEVDKYVRINVNEKADKKQKNP